MSFQGLLFFCVGTIMWKQGRQYFIWLSILIDETNSLTWSECKKHLNNPNYYLNISKFVPLISTQSFSRAQINQQDYLMQPKECFSDKRIINYSITRQKREVACWKKMRLMASKLFFKTWIACCFCRLYLINLSIYVSAKCIELNYKNESKGEDWLDFCERIHLEG